MNRQERRAAARRSRSHPNGVALTTPDALYALGLAHLRGGRLTDAQACCDKALAADCSHADSLFLRGLLAIEANDCDHAVEQLARAIGQAAKVEYLIALGEALRHLRRFDDAAQAFDKVVQLKPDNPQVWQSLANVLGEAGRTDQALLAWRRVLQLNPGDRGAAYQCLEKHGLALHNIKRFEEALSEHRQAHALDPANPNACINIGAALQSLRRDEEAVPWFDRAIALKPDLVLARRNKALSLIQLGRFDEAFTILNQTRTIHPGNPDVEWNLALLQLMAGDFDAGWVGREARWRGQMRPANYPEFSQPMWLGDTRVEGKIVLVQEDEGLGDTIQFARYIPLLAALGARVILVVRDQLVPLLSGLPGVAQCISNKSVGALPPFDLHCPVCSLPYAFRTRLDTIPANIPYLPVPSTDLVRSWRDRLEQLTSGNEKLRIGLVWSGNPQHDNDHNRSIALQSLLGIIDIDATFLSLQKDLRAGDKALVEQSGILDLTSHLTNFAETASLVCCLDLVVTVDTSVAHLSGALGRPTWVLLPFVPDYRWLLHREDSPWYPTMRLFRQDARRDWGEVLGRVRRAFDAVFGSRQTTAPG